MAKKVKVSGYAKKVTYNGDIEYRNFNPDLTGVQLTTRGGSALFTMGNFSITTNLDPKVDKDYITGRYSDFYTLDNLGLTVEETETLLDNNVDTFLNLDKTKLKNYALFGSMTEYVRIALEDIIINWPASLYVSQFNQIGNITYVGDTYENFNYNELTNESTFKVNTNSIVNKFKINYLTNGTIIDTFSETNDLRNLTINYGSYVINNGNEDFKILSFSASTKETNDYIYFKVKGKPFTGTSLSNRVNYHIKPNKTIIDTFFNSLDVFKSYLLNRESIPQYTSTFTYPKRTDSGIIMYTEKSLTWPVNDGYNIEFDSNDYTNYAASILDITSNYDLTETNLMTRFLVSESISDFDTAPVILGPEHQDTTTGQKVNKTLNVYGRSFDDINQFIQGISFAHAVSYDKKENTPDKYLKDLAKVLGWELASTVTKNGLLDLYTDAAETSYSGLSIGLTPVEAESELWRRLILNTPWLWKSKGARKSIEFLLNFMGIPRGLVTFNEYIYKAKAPINMDLFYELLDKNGLDSSLEFYPVDTDGFPKPLPDNDDMYFQKGGLWYRQTGGNGATLDTSIGNNPHAGPYDGGRMYIDQFKKLIPNFSATTLETVETKIYETNLFTNYSQGVINNYSGQTYIDIVDDNNLDISQCVVYTSEVIQDPMPEPTLTPCGCPCDGTDDILSVCVKKGIATPNVCNDLTGKKYIDNKSNFWVVNKENYNNNGELIGEYETAFISKECCTILGGTPSLYYADYNTGIELFSSYYVATSGYVCCSSNLTCGCNVACGWSILDNGTYQIPNTSQQRLAPIAIPEESNEMFIVFKTHNGFGQRKVVTVDGSNCPINYTIPVSGIKDPFTGEIGVGCKLTQLGLNDINNGSYLQSLFQARNLGNIGCCDILPQKDLTPNTIFKGYE